MECYSGIKQWAGKAACNCQLDVCFLCLVSPLHLGGRSCCSLQLLGRCLTQATASKTQANKTNSLHFLPRVLLCFVLFSEWVFSLLPMFAVGRSFDYFFIFLMCMTYCFSPLALFLFLFFKQSKCLYSVRALLSEFWIPSVLWLLLCLYLGLSWFGGERLCSKYNSNFKMLFQFCM